MIFITGGFGLVYGDAAFSSIEVLSWERAERRES